MTILDKIVKRKREIVDINKLHYPVSTLEKGIYFERETYSFKSSLIRANTSGIISEFKRASPSKGVINDYADVEETTMAYAQAGASALSVLTDTEFFGGKNSDLSRARKHCNIPILRKDFIIDEYQIYEAKAIGADVILLIASVLTVKEISVFTDLAHKLKMEVLLEIHDASEMDKVSAKEDVIGINNRNLKTFEVNLQQSINLANSLPQDMVKIAESGIKSIEDIKLLKNAGFSGFLMGELFMKEENPGVACEMFIKNLGL